MQKFRQSSTGRKQVYDRIHDYLARSSSATAAVATVPATTSVEAFTTAAAKPELLLENQLKTETANKIEENPLSFPNGLQDDSSSSPSLLFGTEQLEDKSSTQLLLLRQQQQQQQQQLLFLNPSPQQFVGDLNQLKISDEK